jgi:hypothetical protein
VLQASEDERTLGPTKTMGRWFVLGALLLAALVGAGTAGYVIGHRGSGSAATSPSECTVTPENLPYGVATSPESAGRALYVTGASAWKICQQFATEAANDDGPLAPTDIGDLYVAREGKHIPQPVQILGAHKSSYLVACKARSSTGDATVTVYALWNDSSGRTTCSNLQGTGEWQVSLPGA